MLLNEAILSVYRDLLYDTHAYILDPCIREFSSRDLSRHLKISYLYAFLLDFWFKGHKDSLCVVQISIVRVNIIYLGKLQSSSNLAFEKGFFTFRSLYQ